MLCKLRQQIVSYSAEWAAFESVFLFVLWNVHQRSVRRMMAKSEELQKEITKIRRWDIEYGETESLGRPFTRMSESSDGKFVLFEDFKKIVSKLERRP